MERRKKYFKTREEAFHPLSISSIHIVYIVHLLLAYYKIKKMEFS